MVGERFDPGPTEERRVNCEANTATEEQSSDSSKEVSKFNVVLGLVASVLRNWLPERYRNDRAQCSSVWLVRGGLKSC